MVFTNIFVSEKKSGSVDYNGRDNSSKSIFFAGETIASMCAPSEICFVNRDKISLVEIYW